MKDSATLRLEVGKYYRTRDGRKVRIYATDGVTLSPVHGAYAEPHGRWSMLEWSLSGTYLYVDDEHSKDIVGEWSDTGVSSQETSSLSAIAAPAPEATESKMLVGQNGEAVRVTEEGDLYYISGIPMREVPAVPGAEESKTHLVPTWITGQPYPFGTIYYPKASSSSPVCECGGDKAGGTHSDWCPKGAGK